jgi:hypothetical protein
MADATLVNSMYPLGYFTLPNTDRIQYPAQYWWSSLQRYPSVDPDHPWNYLATDKGGSLTSEYLEIDFGRVREINYMNFQVIRVPVDIRIEYDAVSPTDGSHEWTAVTRVKDMPFDDAVHYQANSKNAWLNAEFYMADTKGHLIATRFLRIRFTRRDVRWPANGSISFRWPISIKELRTARYVSALSDSRGLLIDTGAGDTQINLDVLPDNSTVQVRQQFAMPSDYERSGIDPALLGFSFECMVTASATQGQSGSAISTPDDVSWMWSLHDVTTATSIPVRHGIVKGAPNNGRAWIDVLFDTQQTIYPTPSTVYELRLRSLDASVSSAIFAVTYATTSPMPGAHPLQQFHEDGSSTLIASHCLAFRAWGDVADEGRDVLGNQYRYGTQRDKAGSVFDNDQVGWTSEPQPSAEAVEALYFDVRKDDPTNATRNITTVIDAIQVAPRTYGLQMHIYYTEMGLQGEKPKNRNAWDNLLWTPINVTYNLKANQVYELPLPVRASFIKLEFSRLQPLPFRLPTYPKLPSKEYHRYPTWVEQQFANSLVKRTVNDWFVNKASKKERKVLASISDPVLEFQYKEREFLAALSTGSLQTKYANSQFVDIKHRAIVDPVTGSRLFLDDGSLFQGTLTVNVNRESVLGQLVADRYDPTVPNIPAESPVNHNTPPVPQVSTSNNRVAESFAHIASTPMWFNRVCRHAYKVERAAFNKQAFFAGIRAVSFLRKDYTTRRDDTLIVENLYDTSMLDENTFLLDNPSQIWKLLPPASANGATSLELFVSYTVNDVSVTDEEILFEAPAALNPTPADVQPVTLREQGGPASNVILATQPGGKGTIFNQGVDFDVTYDTDAISGEVINLLTVSTLHSRLVASLAAGMSDADIVVGRAVITAFEEYTPFVDSPNEDLAAVIGVAVITATERMDYADAGEVDGVADIHDGHYIDAAVVTGAVDRVALANSAESYFTGGGAHYFDAGEVDGVGVVGAAFNYQDAGEVDGSAQISGLTAMIFADGAGEGVIPGGVSVFQGTPGSNSVETTSLSATYPDASLISAYIRWADLQPNGPNDISGWDTITTNGITLDESIDDAAAQGYQIILRIGGGVDAPVWLYNPAVVTTPVPSLSVIATNATLGAVTIPYPQASTLVNTWYRQVMTLVAAKLNGTTAAGNLRKHYIFMVPASGVIEAQPDMDFSYGPSATYSGGATLTGTINSSAATFTLTGTLTSYPTANFLLQIDSELVMCASRSGTTITVASGGRGWSGSTAAGHTAATAVQYASAGMWPSTGVGTYNGKTGVFDAGIANETAWLSVDTVANNQNAVQACVAAEAEVLLATLGAIGVRGGIGLATVFGDNYAVANNLVNIYANNLNLFLTNLAPGNDGSGNVTTVNNGTTYDTYYEGYDPAGGGVMEAIVGFSGSVPGVRTAPKSVYDTFTNPYNGGASALRVLFDNSAATWPLVFVEITPDLIDTNPGLDSTYNYLF